MLRHRSTLRSSTLVAALLACACSSENAANEPPFEYPAPDAFEAELGPGGPASTFTSDQLYVNCAFLDGTDMDADHHNLVVMYDGYLMLPWSPEFGRGGISFFEFDDPCNAREVGNGFSDRMRESHSIGFSNMGGRWAVVDAIEGALIGKTGVQFWDVSDPTAPAAVSELILDGTFYPDAYRSVTLSVFWQAPYVYAAAADSGIFVIDAKDPLEPKLVTQYVFDPVLRAGQVQAIGNLLVVTTAEGPRTALLDISDPTSPQPIPGGDFEARDAEGEPREAYFTNTTNGFVYYARKEGGGGVIIYDIRDPENPVRSGGYKSDGNGGYVFVKDEYAFTGESNFAAIYDISDHANISEVARLNLEGDLDTMTPVGNVVVLSVDDDANDDQASAVAPWQTEPDSTPPRVTWSWPNDGASNLALTSRIGITFNEMVSVKSAWEGSVRLYETGTEPDRTRVDGVVSAQENIVNFHPKAPLKPATSYTLEVPAGGIRDFNGNAITEPFQLEFTTVGG